MGMCDRLGVLHQGRLIAEFDRDRFKEEDILHCQCGWAAVN
jgi:ABC-type sugar transport system ATPase subunit